MCVQIFSKVSVYLGGRGGIFSILIPKRLEFSWNNFQHDPLIECWLHAAEEELAIYRMILLLFFFFLICKAEKSVRHSFFILVFFSLSLSLYYHVCIWLACFVLFFSLLFFVPTLIKRRPFKKKKMLLYESNEGWAGVI